MNFRVRASQLLAAVFLFAMVAAAANASVQSELAFHRGVVAYGEDHLDEAKGQAQEIIRRAERRETEIVEEAKGTARNEGERILTAARSEIDKEVHQARDELRKQLATLVVAGAGQILGREVDAAAHSQMIDDLTRQL